jgi:hypothetical protein
VFRTASLKTALKAIIWAASANWGSNLQCAATIRRSLMPIDALVLPPALPSPRLGVTKANTMLYRASKFDCGACALKSKCCPNTPARKVPRSIHEGARDMARDIAKTDAYVVSRRERKKVEMLFAHLKRIVGLDRLRLRGPCGARDEFHLATKPPKTGSADPDAHVNSSHLTSGGCICPTGHACRAPHTEPSADFFERNPPTARIPKVRFRASPRRSSASRGGVHQWVLSVRFYPLDQAGANCAKHRLGLRAQGLSARRERPNALRSCDDLPLHGPAASALPTVSPNSLAASKADPMVQVVRRGSGDY